MIRLLICGLIFFFIATPLRAHDHWISDGHYLDPVTGQHCCNENDCKELSEADIASVVLTRDGLIVQGASFLKSQLHKSEDGKWYRCANRCVFRPVEG